jgi:hypothetical protein
MPIHSPQSHAGPETDRATWRGRGEKEINTGPVINTGEGTRYAGTHAETGGGYGRDGGGALRAGPFLGPLRQRTRSFSFERDCELGLGALTR